LFFALNCPNACGSSIKDKLTFFLTFEENLKTINTIIMRKVYLLIPLIFWTLSIFGQSKISKEHNLRPFNGTLKSNRATEWFNYPATLRTINPNNVQGFYTYIFPDSLPLAYFTDDDGNLQSFRPNQHHAGQVIDPYSTVFSDENSGMLGMPAGLDYTVNSISIPYAYYRKNPATEPDTLFVQYYREDAMTLRNYNFNNQTFYWARLGYNFNTNLGVNAIRTDTVLLTTTSAADLDDDGRIDLNDLNFAVPANQRFAVSFAFKPGYNYDLNDTIDHTLDPVINPLNTFITFVYYDQRGAAPEANRYNHSIWVEEQRYNAAPSGFNGYFYPGVLYDNAEHYWIDFEISSAAGVSKTSGIYKTSLAPNPVAFGNNASLIIESPVSGSVNATITDISGKIVSASSHDVFTGKQNLQLNTSNLAPGVYLVSVNNGTPSKLMIVK
jgi:hypothetical protein